MELKDTIKEIRVKYGFSQEVMAEKLSVTRQAVSRWENGETIPNIETLKLISKEFSVSANILLGLPDSAVCQSCGMDLASIEDFGTNRDDTVQSDYCRYCMEKGVFTHNRTIDEQVELNLCYLDEYNKEKGLSYTTEQARMELTQHLATLKRWRV